ncbi:MAG: hypothetical protein IPK69_07470 [Phycisphaerales bacterium]|nr:MAG: hypothetical protein IPK69_07470 [Phycisphaerales bacterium]
MPPPYGPFRFLKRLFVTGNGKMVGGVTGFGGTDHQDGVVRLWRACVALTPEPARVRLADARDDKEYAMKKVMSGLVGVMAIGVGSAMACPPDETWTDDSGNVLMLGEVGEPQVRVFRHGGRAEGDERETNPFVRLYADRLGEFVETFDGEVADLDVLVDRLKGVEPEMFSLREGDKGVFIGKPRVKTLKKQIVIGPDGRRMELEARPGQTGWPGVGRVERAESREMDAARQEIVAKITSLHAEIARLEKKLDAISKKERVMRAGPDREGPGRALVVPRGSAPEVRVERRGFIIGPDGEKRELTPREMDGLRLEERRVKPAPGPTSPKARQRVGGVDTNGERFEIELEGLSDEIPEEILEMMGVEGHEIVHRPGDPI